MTMCGIQNNNVNLGFCQSCHTIQNIGSNTNTCTAEQTSLCILCCKRIFDRLLNILDRDQALQIEVLINDRQLLFSCLCQNLLCFFQCDTFGSRNQTFTGHGFFNLLGKICLEFQVAVGNDADQLFALCDRDTGNTEFCHQFIGICKGMLRG